MPRPALPSAGPGASVTPDLPARSASVRDLRPESAEAWGAPVGDQSVGDQLGGAGSGTGPSAGSSVARKFVGQLAQLDLDAVRAAVASWHQTMRAEPQAWFAAEAALGQAVVTSGRRGAQEPLLMEVAQAFARAVWYGPEARRAQALAPELRTGASEATGQYLATLAMLALLVRDHLEAATFALLYRPFAAIIPPAALAPE